MKLVRILLLTLMSFHLLLPNALPVAAQEADPLLACFGLLPEDAETVLGEAVDTIPTADEESGYCTYASVAGNSVPSADDLFPTYGPRGEHQYLAVTVWPQGSATDPWMYLAFAILDQEQAKLSEFMGTYGQNDLEALANAESTRQGVTRQFLPDLADGALWYWQETSAGDHLAGIYALSGEQRVAVQALVNPERSADDVLAAMSATVEKWVENNKAFSIPANALLRVDPVFVDDCPNFSPYDAAAILQEPVNADAPVGNLIFGPLSIEYEESLRGLCGYTNDLAVGPDSISPTQTHLATDLPYSHAVAAGHWTGEIQHFNNGTMMMDWMELIAMADMVAAANLKNDGKVFDYLYGTFNIGDFASWTDALEQLAQGSPSFKVSRIELPQEDARDELLWLWQTLDEGYFSLLVSRQDDDFDVVAALLGTEVTEKTVLGYSQVLIEKLANPVAESANSETSCSAISDHSASSIVGEAVQGTVVKSSEGEGCKYTPANDRNATQPDDFSPLFQTFGLLAGIAPANSAERLIQGMVEELANSGSVQDGEAFGAALQAIAARDYATALQLVGEIEWNNNQWQIEALSGFAEPTVLLSGKSGNGWNQFFLLSNRPDGGIYYLTSVLSNEIADVQGEIEAALMALKESANGLAATDADTNPPADTSEIDNAACALFSAEAAQAIVGSETVAIPAASERGEGCVYVAKDEYNGETSTRFALEFSNGMLVGVMVEDELRGLLSELLLDAGVSDRRIQRSLERGEFANALRFIARLEADSAQWSLSALPELGESAISIHGRWEEGNAMTLFLVTQASGEVVLVIPLTEEPGDFEKIRGVVVQSMMEKE